MQRQPQPTTKTKKKQLDTRRIIAYTIIGVSSFLLGAVSDVDRKLIKPMYYFHTVIADDTPRDLWYYHLTYKKNDKGELELYLTNDHTKKSLRIHSNGHAGSLREDLSYDLNMLHEKVRKNRVRSRLEEKVHELKRGAKHYLKTLRGGGF